MNKGVARATDIYATLAHVGDIETFAKPFIAVAGTRDQVMKGNRLLAAAEGAAPRRGSTHNGG